MSSSIRQFCLDLTPMLINSFFDIRPKFPTISPSRLSAHFALTPKFHPHLHFSIRSKFRPIYAHTPCAKKWVYVTPIMPSVQNTDPFRPHTPISTHFAIRAKFRPLSPTNCMSLSDQYFAPFLPIYPISTHFPLGPKFYPSSPTDATKRPFRPQTKISPIFVYLLPLVTISPFDQY